MNKLALEPICFDDLIAENAEVRALEVIVTKMDIRSLGFAYSKTKSTGRVPYDLENMFKIYVYSYFNGIRKNAR